MEQKTLYIIDLKNEWWEKEYHQMNNRNTLCYRVFSSEKVTRDYMDKIIASVMGGEDVEKTNPIVEEKRDRFGIVSISVEFKSGYDAIANTNTNTTISARRVCINDEVPENPFDDAKSEIYIS